jgi:hypothetical protein
MKSFWLNGYSDRQERWALDGHRWVAAEPRRNGFDFWGYQDGTPEIAHVGSGAHREQLSFWGILRWSNPIYLQRASATVLSRNNKARQL